MELIIGEEYYDALGCICRAVAHLAGKKRTESNEDYDINYDEEGREYFVVALWANDAIWHQTPDPHWLR